MLSSPAFLCLFTKAPPQGVFLASLQKNWAPTQAVWLSWSPTLSLCQGQYYPWWAVGSDLSSPGTAALSFRKAKVLHLFSDIPASVLIKTTWMMEERGDYWACHFSWYWKGTAWKELLSCPGCLSKWCWMAFALANGVGLVSAFSILASIFLVCCREAEKDCLQMSGGRDVTFPCSGKLHHHQYQKP